MKRLLHVVSFTTDIDSSRRFYRDAMGLGLGADTPFMVNFSVDGTGLMLLAVQPTQRREVELCFESDRVGTVVETLRSRGVEFIDELRHLAFGSVIHFRDPEGNLLSLLQPGSGATLTAAERKSQSAGRRAVAGGVEQTALALAEFTPSVRTGPALTTVIVQVQDMVGARAYFGRVLGLKETVQSPLWVQYDTGEVHLAIHRHHDRGVTDRSMTQPVSFGFSVEDLDEWTAAARARGAEFANVPAEAGLGVAVELRDPEGNLVVVRQYVTDAELQKRLDAARATKTPRARTKRASASSGSRAKGGTSKPAAGAKPKAAKRAVLKAAAPKRATTKSTTRPATKRSAAPKSAAKRNATKRSKPRGNA